jgi:hypothetical protein
MSGAQTREVVVVTGASAGLGREKKGSQDRLASGGVYPRRCGPLAGINPAARTNS